MLLSKTFSVNDGFESRLDHMEATHFMDFRPRADLSLAGSPWHFNDAAIPRAWEKLLTVPAWPLGGQNGDQAAIRSP